MARANIGRFNKVLLDVHDLHRTWVEIRLPGSQLPTRPTVSDLGAGAYLRRWTDAELWRRALAAVDDEPFTAACGDPSDPGKVRGRLGLDEETIAKKRRETYRARQGGRAQAEEDRNRWRVLRDRNDRLRSLASRAHRDVGGTNRAAGERGRTSPRLARCGAIQVLMVAGGRRAKACTLVPSRRRRN